MRMRSLSPRSASTPPIGIRTMFAVASARATTASQAVECVRSHAVHETATACTKKLSHETAEPNEYHRKLRSPKASAMPPRPNLTTGSAAGRRFEALPRLSCRPSARRPHSLHDAAEGFGEALDVGFLRRPAEAEADRAARELRLHTHGGQHV